jgi:hypothetical protein
VAVNDGPDVVDAAVAMTQSPAFTADSVVATPWLNLVDRVQVTAT